MQTPLPDGMTKRGKSYWADFRHRGRRIRKSLSRNLKTATTLLTELRARLERDGQIILDAGPATLPMIDPDAKKHVYFIEAVGLDKVKVGIADDVGRRLAGLQTASPVELRLLAAVPGDESLEQRIHASLSRYRVRGEWFFLTPAVLASIEQIARDVGPESADGVTA